MEWDPGTRTGKETYRFLTGAVAPRPVAWVTTMDGSGLVNAAPFSWFNTVCPDPPLVMLSIGDRGDGSPKDTWRNIRDTEEFVVNIVTRPLAQRMVQTSAEYPPDHSEVEALALPTRPSAVVRPPRLADSPIHLECRLHQSIALAKGHTMVLGRIVHIAADDAVLDAKGLVDPAKAVLVGRMGGSNYADTGHWFQLPWPSRPDALRGPA